MGGPSRFPNSASRCSAHWREAGDDGATLEDLFGRVWKGTFHPLRHAQRCLRRSARLKDSLKPFSDDVSIARDGERYRLAGDALVGVRRRNDSSRSP